MKLNVLSHVDRLLLKMWDSGATDLILTAGAPPLMRVDGELVAADEAVMSGADTASMLDGLLKHNGREPLGDKRELDFSFTWQDQARVRGNAYRQRGTVALALRMVPHTIPSFDWLGLPPAVQQWAQLQRGLILVTGPTGGGKSTTLASLIDWINHNRRVHIVTIEDPIEYVHDHKMSAVDQREVGDDTASFSDALRSALREDPDVLLVGEMRDLESIRFALTIAETGHLVFATLHTNDVAQSLDRIVDVFPADQQGQIRVQLANTLSGICYQRLIPKVGGGLQAAYEVLVANSAVRNLVREGKTNQLRNQLVTGQAEGMQTLEMSLSHLVEQGVISLEQALAVSLFPKELPQPRRDSAPALVRV
ncbi:MAG: twitching motility protein PilT [Frankiaceae bacterium]|nr:twitching motility protein PilT [Frankiaceae bacterium]MDX6224781.1 twitching motility protein PilT [Frankiales bacterium]MDX6275646.1 twitching motility protein PilT [Frankiales bacterium]